MMHSVLPSADVSGPAIDHCSFGITIQRKDGSTDLVGAGFIGPFEIWCQVCVPLTSEANLRIWDPRCQLAPHLTRSLKIKKYIGEEGREQTMTIGELRPDGRLTITAGMILPSGERLILTA